MLMVSFHEQKVLDVNAIQIINLFPFNISFFEVYWVV